MKPKRKLELIPTCIGTYQDGEDCDGDPDGEGDDTLPCSWRANCIPFQQYLRESEKPIAEFVRTVGIGKDLQVATGWDEMASPVGRTFDEFKAFCAGLARRYLIRSVEERKTAAELQEQRAKKRPYAKRASLSKDKVRRTAIQHLITHYCVQLREKMGRRINMDRRCNTLTMPGDLYMVDYRRRSGYIGVFCRHPNAAKFGKDAAVSSLVPLYRTLTLNVSVPVDIRKVQRKLGSVASTMRIEPIRNGAFRTIIRGADKDQLDTISTLIADFDKSGILQLPPR